MRVDAGVGIDLHFGDVAAVGEGRAEAALRHHGERLLLRQLEQADFLLRSAHLEHALRVLDLRRLDFQLVARRATCACSISFSAASLHTLPAPDRGARAAGVVADERLHALPDAHLFQRHARARRRRSSPNVVSWPCPCECDTVKTSISPAAVPSITTWSLGNRPAPVFSMTVAMPSPRSFPAFSDFLRRAANPFQSANLSARSSTPWRSAVS